MLDIDKQSEWENPKHGVFSPHTQFKACDNINRFLRKPKPIKPNKEQQNETVRN